MQAATSLVKAHRTHGHLAARLDPLGSEPVGDPALEPATVGLTPEVMEQIPAHILRIQVPGATLAEALPHLRETYCGTIAYEIEHISDHQQRVWLRNRIESGKYRRPLSPEEKKRVLSRLTNAEALETYLHRAFIGRQELLDRGPRHADPDARRVVRARGRRRRARRLHGHGAPRAAERARARGRAALLRDPGRVRGREGHRRRDRAPARRHRRREVPPGRDRHLQDRRGQGDQRHARVQPEPPRVRRPRRRGPRARPADRARQAARRALPAPRAARADPRRRRLPGRGRRRRDDQPRGARRATPPAACCTSSPTTRSGSRPSPRSRARRATPPTSRRASTSRSST